MKKLTMVALMAVATTSAFAQADVVKNAKKLLDKGSVTEAISAVQPALTAGTNEDKAAAWNLLSSAYYKQFSDIQAKKIENQVKQTNEPVDEATMNKAIVAALEAAMKCDEFDNMPNEKGKVKPKFRQPNQQIYQNGRLQCINAGQYEYNQKNYAGDYIFMRMEEACLIAAEAYCRLGDELEAKHWLSELESRRNPAYASRLVHLTGSEQTFASVGTVETLLDEILLQRRIELWGEAGRIYDILRLRKGWTRNWTVNGEPSNHTNLLSKYPEYLGFPADFRECIMMIPQAEIDNNPSIGPEDQNPYVE